MNYSDVECKHNFYVHSEPLNLCDWLYYSCSGTKYCLPRIHVWHTSDVFNLFSFVCNGYNLEPKALDPILLDSSHTAAQAELRLMIALGTDTMKDQCHFCVVNFA